METLYMCYKRHKGLSIKDVRSQWGLSSADIFRIRGKGILQMRKSTLFSAKNSGFFEIYGGREKREGGRVEPVRTFFGTRGEGSIFPRFCADAFYWWPL